jgi:hypothetical protein
LTTDDGVLSLDFLAGFTIFMLALIVVVSMVPGLLAGLQSSGIDYDAVAYRTGVILVEDPGWPVYPPWELYDVDHKEEIERIGLAISRDTPNILLSTKVDKFFDSGGFFDYPDDYRERVLFGEVPYFCNISLMRTDTNAVRSVGDPLPQGYGYIRRVVKIKEPSVATLDLSPSGTAVGINHDHASQSFTVRLNCAELLNPSIGPAYRIDPRIEPITVNVNNFEHYLNTSDPSTTYTSATLEKVRFHKNFAAGSIPFPYTYESPEKYQFSIDGTPTNLTPNAPVSSSLSLVLHPASLPLDQNSVIDITFTFKDDPPQTDISGMYLYSYTNVTRPALKTGILEVAIW